MSIGKKQLQRLLKIAAQLKENRYPNCKTLVEDFRKLDIENNINIACSSKTIRRDIKTLQDDFNCPVEFDWGKNGYYLKHHGWNFDCPALFEEHEMLASVLGARLAEEIFPEPLRGSIRQAVDFQLSQNNPDFLDTAIVNSLSVFPGLKAQIDAETFMTVFCCWQNHNLVEIKYRDISEQVTTRQIEPHALVYYGTSWYIKARCLLRDEIRNFAIHRIISTEALEYEFTPDKAIVDGLLEDKFLNYEEVTDIEFICINRIKNFLEAGPLHRDQSIKPYDDDHFLFKVPAMPEHELIQWILYQAGDATLLKPEQPKQKIREAAERLLKQHRQADF